MRSDWEAGSTAAWLSPEEKERAARGRPGWRRRFLRTRTALRQILAGYCDTVPDEVALRCDERGKPALADSQNGTEAGRAAPLAFNLSHSRDLALCIVGEMGEVGVDVERVRADRPLDRLARRYFSPEEVDFCRRDPGTTGFFRIWTRKEALLKAAGAGLSRPLAQVDTLRGFLDGKRYWLASFVPREGFAAAVACERAPASLRMWSWEGRSAHFPNPAGAGRTASLLHAS